MPGGDVIARRITGIARRHFFAHGLKSVTMGDLAAELGMSKKTLYAAFRNKMAILEAVLLEKFGEIESDLERITSECSNDFLPAVQRLLECVRGHAEEVQPAFVRDLRREAPDTFVTVERRRREVFHRQFGKLLNQGRKAGIVRNDLAVGLVIEILLGAVEAIMNPPKLSELGLVPKAGISAILSVFFEGVLVTPRRRGS